MVKNTCSCTTSEARPGEMLLRMARNSRPNWPTPSSTPNAAILCQGAVGRGMKSNQGRAESAKRSVASRNGGKPSSPQRITTKLVPQTKTTERASRRWVVGKDRSAVEGGAPV